MRGEEIKKILKNNNIIFKVLADKMKVSPQHLTSILKSPDMPTSRVLEISKHTGIKRFGLFLIDENKVINKTSVDETKENVPEYEMIDNLLELENKNLKQHVKDLEYIIELQKKLIR